MKTNTAYETIYKCYYYTFYKKLSYPQRKCASNVATLYGADGIST